MIFEFYFPMGHLYTHLRKISKGGKMKYSHFIIYIYRQALWKTQPALNSPFKNLLKLKIEL